VGVWIERMDVVGFGEASGSAEKMMVVVE